MTVRISKDTAHEPDALVRCGPKLAADAVEVPIPSSSWRSFRRPRGGSMPSANLPGYFSLSSVHHYVIADPERLPVIHHQRQQDGTILTRLLSEGGLRFDPPGFEIAIGQLLG